jgi:hypothetical protein
MILAGRSVALGRRNITNCQKCGNRWNQSFAGMSNEDALIRATFSISVAFVEFYVKIISQDDICASATKKH